MAMESDGFAEAIEGQLRVAITAGAQLAERAVRARAESLQQARLVSQQAARELQTRFDAERRAAQAELATVHQDTWWDRASVDQIGRAHQVAQAWASEDPEASRAAERIRSEVQKRYGVTPDALQADPEKVQTWIAQQQESDATQRQVDQTAATDNAEAAMLMRQADLEERRAEDARAAALHEPDPTERAQADVAADRHETQAQIAYDSAERRDATAAELREAGVPEKNVETRMRADVSQARPATHAVTATATKAPKARKTSTKPRQAQRGAQQR